MPVPLSAQEPPWKAEARRWGLDEIEIAQLEREGLVVGRESYASPIEAYRPREVPYFVTSDIALYVFARLLEDSMRPQERANAVRLRRSLVTAWRKIRDPQITAELSDPLLLAARLRMRRIVAVARLLLGAEPELLPEDREPVLELVAAIQRGTGRAQPTWMGPFDAGFTHIDLERFRPIGIYAGDDELEKFFRAARWLQMVPFRVRREDEMAALWHLLQIVPWSSRHQGEVQELSGGAPGDWSPDLLADLEPSFDLEALRTRIAARRATWPRKITLDLPHAPETKPSDEEGFRWLPSAMMPDGPLIHALGSTGPLPRVASLLDIGAALGSHTARSAIGAERARLVAESSVGILADPSYFGETLATLSLLLDPPEPEAPPLFHSEAWHRKALASAAAGWIQTRAVFVRHAQTLYGTLGSSRDVGFVEPDPRFFEALGALCTKLTGLSLDHESAGVLEVTKRAQKLAEIFVRLEGLADQQLRGRELATADCAFYGSLDLELRNLAREEREQESPRACEVMRVLGTTDLSIVAGTGRPRALWLLYPWKGELVLCRGAVLPVHEVEAAHALTHTEWSQRLNEGRDLELPAWLKPIYAHGR
ncbi:MAG: DUF3160 domain-containing protein [Planctomycetes bacterium]|nr:DUF3160 domain-containing protein [Planctomycetota bacterium]